MRPRRFAGERSRRTGTSDQSLAWPATSSMYWYSTLKQSALFEIGQNDSPTAAKVGNGPIEEKSL